MDDGHDLWHGRGGDGGSDVVAAAVEGAVQTLSGAVLLVHEWESVWASSVKDSIPSCLELVGSASSNAVGAWSSSVTDRVRVVGELHNQVDAGLQTADEVSDGLSDGAGVAGGDSVGDGSSLARVTRDASGELSESGDGLRHGQGLAGGVVLVGEVVQGLLHRQDVDVGVTTVDDLEGTVGQVAGDESAVVTDWSDLVDSILGYRD